MKGTLVRGTFMRETWACPVSSQGELTLKNNSAVKGGIRIKVSGTSPLSFDAIVGSILHVKEFSPSSHSRPTLGGGFKSRAFLIFNGKTKVGRLSPANLRTLGGFIPSTCKVVEVDKARKSLVVLFE